MRSLFMNLMAVLFVFLTIIISKNLATQLHNALYQVQGDEQVVVEKNAEKHQMYHLKIPMYAQNK